MQSHVRVTLMDVAARVVRLLSTVLRAAAAEAERVQIHPHNHVPRLDATLCTEARGSRRARR